MVTNSIAQKIWSYCDTLRDDGVSYGDYVEQITYLLFLKMADENSNEFNLPKVCNWNLFKNLEKGDLIGKYEDILKELGESGGMLTKIFAGAQNKIHDSSKLKKLIRLIDEENWTSKEMDIKGEIYESLLQKNAENSGAGQYFTPRSVITTMVNCLKPKVDETISDPSCGTGGFFLGALEFISKTKLDAKQRRFVKFDMFHGWEIESSTARLCLMNLFLHGVGDLKKTPNIDVTDSLKVIPKTKVDIVLANPPFGKSSSDIPTIDEKQASKEGYFLRTDFWATTGNKQLAFLQHIFTMLKDTGRAAVVLPDNVLFEGGAGETIRKAFLDNTNLHTILRLPTGIFYAQGVKANVLFFEKMVGKKTPLTKEVWFYDYRTNVSHSPKKNPLHIEDLKEFMSLYHARIRKETYSTNNENGRWRKYTYDQLILRDKINLDITWIKGHNDVELENIAEPEILLQSIIEDLEGALINIKAIKENFE